MVKEFLLRFGLAISLLVLFCGRDKLYATAESNSTTRIVGGNPTTVKFIPYIVNLHLNGVFNCGGTLIARRIVVTAAHCVKGKRPRSLSVQGGTSLLSQKGVVRKVRKYFLPKSFNFNNLNMDVAVLELDRPMFGTNIKPIKLCNKSWKPGDEVRISGWGLTSENANNVPVRLQTTQVSLVSKRKCIQQYQGRIALTESMFCASVPGKRDACSGDSGGPLVYGGRLCGIVSWGLGCARKQYPGVYTSIRRVRKFISNVVQKINK